MIKRCFLCKATPRGSKARSSGRRCGEEGETETEFGMGTGTGVGLESRIVEQNLICETEWETERETETGIGIAAANRESGSPMQMRRSE